MNIFIHEKTKTFHLQNDLISYIMTVLPDGSLGQLYFGKRIHDKEDFSYLLEGCIRSHSALLEDNGEGISLEHVKQEYPVYGSSDFREGALEILQDNGSRLPGFVYESCEVTAGKPKLQGLPATYTESDEEAATLRITMKDPVNGLVLQLLYTVFAKGGVIARSAEISNEGNAAVSLTKAMSLCVDLPDADYDWIQLSGSWARERYPMQHRLHQGIQAVESLRGHSSHQHNPFLILKRPSADEFQGEVLGFSLLYSGNFLAQAQVDTYDVTRVLMGIHPGWFQWKLEPGEHFQTPEAVIVYSENGLNGMSQTFHKLFQTRLARGIWKEQPRPILINNWEATYFDFNEEKILAIAEKARECGVELFVLDDGWFGSRRSDNAGLGDWVPAPELLPNGISGLSEKVTETGMKFGLWFEPEMVNPDSDLFRAHPDWALGIPERRASLSRHQRVLDFSRREVVDCIHEMIAKILRESKISYIKWDMNRSITECYSQALPADRQGEVFHRYILGVYDLYERLIQEFPEVLFESCAGGGGRFDAGLLYYAPQAWTSDDTDAVERIKIQYGTSYAYPISSMGSHVSAVPNHQVNRSTPLKTRADVAYFGTFGYELDLNKLTAEEQEEVKAYTQFMKDHRSLLQFGTFYRLQSPFEGNEAAWMVVNEDRSEAIAAGYRILSRPNGPFTRLKLAGLDPEKLYEVEGVGRYYGDELMNLGIITSDATSCKTGENIRPAGDFVSELYLLKEVL
ncbi:MAG: alpha-galactosidase [Lachnospiraceae bacterium]|nr:alpha-galactosidase [Lachnospiraceae bacterium]